MKWGASDEIDETSSKLEADTPASRELQIPLRTHLNPLTGGHLPSFVQAIKRT